jgi:hypothetical protein
MNKILSSVGFTGTRSAFVTFNADSYTFVCDAHSSEMYGSFKVSWPRLDRGDAVDRRRSASPITDAGVS